MPILLPQDACKTIKKLVLIDIRQRRKILKIQFYPFACMRKIFLSRQNIPLCILKILNRHLHLFR